MGIKIKLSGIDKRDLTAAAAVLRQQFGERLELDEPVQIGQFDPVFVVYGEIAGAERALTRDEEADLAIDELYGGLADEPELERLAYGFDVMEALMRHADVRYNHEAERAEWLFQQGIGTWAVWLNITRSGWIVGRPDGKTPRVKRGLLYETVYQLISNALSAD